MKRDDYEIAGVSITTANKAKEEFKEIVSKHRTGICNPINRVGAFASLIDIDLSGFAHPVFVMKSEEPGSKQLLAIDNNRVESIAYDLINHLVNDIIVMGAIPCAVLDTIICGKFQKEIILRLVKAINEACRENDCVLVGGETSEQPGVLPVGGYVLQASVLGVVEKGMIVDGSTIKEGDAVIALASNGLHTNGYSLARKLMNDNKELASKDVLGESFLDAILKPHTPYIKAVRLLIDAIGKDLHGMAHITGGGIHDNLIRILGEGICAEIDLSKIVIPKIFSVIREYGAISDEVMLSTFNTGVGLIAVVDSNVADNAVTRLNSNGFNVYRIGVIRRNGERAVRFTGRLNW